MPAADMNVRIPMDCVRIRESDEAEPYRWTRLDYEMGKAIKKYFADDDAARPDPVRLRPAAARLLIALGLRSQPPVGLHEGTMLQHAFKEFRVLSVFLWGNEKFEKQSEQWAKQLTGDDRSMCYFHDPDELVTPIYGQSRLKPGTKLHGA